ncbi:ras-related protein Rab-24-like [Hydractinia symbiolongicarpus]|uniref:ras-related protein Rab-24-like n=1 Tax=Hydractinia symbiolongicarpus TaxID=13093 RepID=UPI00254B54FE|nr:ras-related protein Rab-24-like [Hydractinia symbiolongicarpus]
MSNQKVDLKVVLLGKEYGGKTSLVERFIHMRFNASIPYQNTIGAAFGAKAMIVDGKSITLGIWDTAGSERYEAMSRIYYRGAKAAIVCYDLTDDTSWDRARFWVQEVHGHEEECKIYLCGTKRDLLENKERPIDYHDTTDYADTINAKLFETSSKTGENIDELFHQIATDYLASGHHSVLHDPNNIQLSASPTSAQPWHKRATSMCCGS